MTELRAVKANHLVAVTERYLTSGEVPSDWDPHTELLDYRIDLNLVKDLCSYAAENFPATKQGDTDPESLTMDAWLAPRLHAALRIPRRIASDGRVWAWLALECHKYLEARFESYEDTDLGRVLRMNPYRVRREPLRNGLSRLWWGAEMVRNGPDYSNVETLFLRVRTAEFALELHYSLYRPAAIAFVRVAEGRDGGERLDDTPMKQLSKQLRIHLSLRGLEFAHLHRAEDRTEFDDEWASHRPRFAQLRDADVSELTGPPSGAADEEAIRSLESEMREILSELKLEGAA